MVNADNATENADTNPSPKRIHWSYRQSDEFILHESQFRKVENIPAEMIADKMVDAQNEAKLVTAKLTSQSVLDKIDRNFYERFGDVQAFAVNKLVIKKSRSSVVETIPPAPNETEELVSFSSSHFPEKR